MRGFRIAPNYPNPFNPSTTIHFSLPQQAYVMLKVFDANGSEVATLVEDEIAAGEHHVTFTPAAATSGLYFYRITAGKFSQTRKAIFIK